MLGFVWLLFVCFVSSCFVLIVVCCEYLCMHMHTRGMHKHTYVCVCILMPRNPDLGFLLFCFFWLVLITCLGLVEYNFHMFRSWVSRITYFACLDWSPLMAPKSKKSSYVLSSEAFTLTRWSRAVRLNDSPPLTYMPRDHTSKGARLDW